MRILLTVIGTLALLIGLIWTGQGAGYINWPASSLMLKQTQWIYYGAATALGGLILIWFGRR
ncbi:MAG: hypothetical protein HXX15_08580 [Rhodopseudomonas sp.]|uniref:hypothetical protein n=1 Tax=Rhodopseudomonas sp. TaxID=1078 RepID=UPI0017AF0E89|nr:hypothetical protein [Rhodopseudomonas sp.]NVN86134.1 hypothetical protein [Rhodopseudomonas sp.]